MQLDRNRTFLNVAKTSQTLNGIAITKTDFQVGDFWTQINHLKRRRAQCDCVLADPLFCGHAQIIGGHLSPVLWTAVAICWAHAARG